MQAEEEGGAQRTLTCSGCERSLEWCSFCGERDCAHPICYRCLAEHLGEWVPYPAAKNS